MNPAYQNHRNRKAIIYRVNLVTKNVNLFDLLCEKIYNSLWRIIINTKYILQEKAMRLKEGRNHHTYQVQEINTELNLERRLEALGLTTEMCIRDSVRIDHFRGFDEYYAIPYGEKTAVNGKWMPGPGIGFFRAVEEKLGRLNIIAEDLGFLTDSVLKLLEDTGFPGMKVIQFAFDSRESANYLPHTYTPNCVVYTGTHDNDTTRGWYHHVDKECRCV